MSGRVVASGRERGTPSPAPPARDLRPLDPLFAFRLWGGAKDPSPKTIKEKKGPGIHSRAGSGAAAPLLALLLALPAAAQTLPTLTGRVVDGAGLIDAASEQALVGKLAAFEAKSSDQIVVATVPDLQGYAIEEFGVALGRAWGIGQAKENNGVILLVSSGDRKVRIEVGYGLEAELTDAATKTIIETDIVPRFKSGDYAGGIAKGVDDIVDVLSGDAEALTARAEKNAEWTSQDTEAITAFIVFVFVFVFLVIGLVLRAARRLSRGQHRAGSRWSRSWGSGWSTSIGSGIGSSGGSWSVGSASGGFSGGGGSFGGGGSSGSW